MNCREVNKQLIDFFDVHTEKEMNQEILEHLKACPKCAQEYNEIKQTFNSIKPSYKICASLNFKERVMDKIHQKDKSINMEEKIMNKSVKIDTLNPIYLLKTGLDTRIGKLALIGALVLIFSFGLSVFNWFAPKNVKVSNSSFGFLAQAVEAMSNMHTVYIKARMRTLPRDNFEMIGLDYDFVQIEMWKKFGDPPKWRVEKPERVVVMDGKSTLLLIKPKHAAKGGIDTGFVGWLKPLLDVHKVLDSEIRLAQEEGSELIMTQKDENGIPKTAVTIEAKAQGNFANDWLKNKSVSDSDNLRIYIFDAQTKFLENLKVLVHSDKGDVLVFEITEIKYDLPLDESLFSLKLPDDVSWYSNSDELLPIESQLQMTPEQAAQAFFQACAESNWDKVLEFWCFSSLDQSFKDYLGGLQIISIGKAFKSGRYPGWFVPYEIKLKNGGIKKFNLAIRNDNPAKRYAVDGGI